METELIITDITRMAGYFICIAGIDKNGRTIRPLYEHQRIEESWCLVDGKEIRPFTRVLIDLEKPRQNSIPPHVEDWFIGPGKVQVLDYCSDEQKKELLINGCFKDTNSIFGTPVIHVAGEGTFVNSGKGCCSIGTIKVKQCFNFNHELKKGRWDYRMKFIDSTNQEYRLKIVDLTFQTFIDYLRIVKDSSLVQIADQINEEVFHRDELYLRIGLSRGWDLHPERCYLQITGIHSFPDYLEDKSFFDLQREIQITNGKRGVREPQPYYEPGLTEPEIPF